MDTKSTKFKYTSGAKILCLLLSVLLFSLGTFCAVELGLGARTYGSEQFFKQAAASGDLPYTATPIFEEVFEEDVNSLLFLASRDEAAYKKSLAGAQKETVEEIVDQYMARQKYLKQQKADPEEEVFGRSPEVRFPVDGSEESLVIDFSYEHMALSEKSIRAELNRQYDEWEANQLESYRSDRDMHSHWLSKNETLKYYVRAVDGTVYTNLKEKPSLSELKQHSAYAGKDSKHNVGAGLHYLDESPTNNPLEGAPAKSAVYCYLEDLPRLGAGSQPGLASLIYDDQDDYVSTRHLYDSLKDVSPGFLLGGMIASFLFGLALLLYLLHLVGRVNPVGSDPVYAPIDKFPGDLHFIFSGLLFSLGLGLPLSFMTDASGNWEILHLFPLFGALTTGLCMLILAEWLTSVCRTVKSGRGFWKHTLFYRLLQWVWKVLKNFAEFCKKSWHLTEYAPKHLHRHAISYVLGYVLINLILALLVSSFQNGTLSIVAFLGLIGFNVWVLAKLAKDVRSLDEIIAASVAGAENHVDTEGLPVSLKTLAENMAVSRERIDAAVSKAVKEEQTRTELITNVTHDLKTPLTSLMNYSDLLTRKAETEELGDEESVKFVGVLHDQSEKLKRLIEDLLEAAKASAGNVQLNLSELNLTELVAQAIAEFSPEMSAKNNDILFLEADGQPATRRHPVYADGNKTYRILSNLLSNAKKYSAPGTRVYATVYDGAAGAEGSPDTTVFELKNISAAPLNISPEELMERFVRGDRSRGETEGNGLGLSIARDLATLMGGNLELSIDGDMFKATVSLPREKQS